MTTSHLLRRSARCLAALAIPLSAWGTLAATSTVVHAAPSCDAPAYSMVERRIVAKADAGRDALIRFVSISKPIYQLDLFETVAWLDAQRARHEACRTTLSRSPSAP